MSQTYFLVTDSRQQAILGQYGRSKFIWITDSLHIPLTPICLSKIYMLIKCYIIQYMWHISTNNSKSRRNSEQKCIDSVFWLQIVTQWLCYQVVIRVLCSACSKGSLQQNSGADNRLRARQIESHPYITYWENLALLRLQGQKTFWLTKRKSFIWTLPPDSSCSRYWH